MTDFILTLATSTQAEPLRQRAVGQAFLLLVVLIIVGILVVLGLLMAGFAWFAKHHAQPAQRRDRFAGVDAWAESGRRAEVASPDSSAEDGEPEGWDDDWEADDE